METNTQNQQEPAGKNNIATTVALLYRYDDYDGYELLAVCTDKVAAVTLAKETAAGWGEPLTDQQARNLEKIGATWCGCDPECDTEFRIDVVRINELI